MEVDRDTWHLAVTKVRRADQIARLLWWGAMLVPPLVAFVAFPEFVLESLLAAFASLVVMRRIAFRLFAGGTASSLQTVIGTAGLDATWLQVAQLLRDGTAQGKGCTWVTVHNRTHVRLVAEGREPGTPPRSSSPWVWAMGGGGV